MEYITLTTKDNRMITAGLASIEGELMNIVVKDLDGIRLGDQVTCQYEESLFHAYVLKIEDYNLYLYLPIQDEKAPNERRRFPRHPCRIEGYLISSEKQFDITIIDISLNGFGFVSKHVLHKEMSYNLQIHAMDEVGTSLELILQNRTELPSNLFRYGAEIKVISEKDLLLLKKYLLNQQLMEKA